MSGFSGNGRAGLTRWTVLLGLMAGLGVVPAGAQQAGQPWTPVGPNGGDARSLAYDPQNVRHLYAGTSAGQLYESNDGGESWTRLARVGKGNDYVLDNMVLDPAHPGTLYVAAWTVDREGGGIYRSSDYGRTWQTLPGMEGKSVRALAMAANDPKLLIAGALDGVFRSRDGGDTWERISPEGHPELRNFESIAVDPRNPDVIYAGTWHLPWKTEDGGRTWNHMKDGIIDDSDVFSIIVDPQNTQNVYLSACSGIYKSENAGKLFHKVQGIPFSARRTRVLQGDPMQEPVVYAGTTEGLWRTSDAGRTWKRMTSPNVIVNDIFVDPKDDKHVLLATDRSGILESGDAAATFHPANQGFAHRQVAALIADDKDPRTLYAGVINDKEYGGVFVSTDAGRQWKQMSAGLGGRDVFALTETDGGRLLAGTEHGVYVHKEGTWEPSNRVVDEEVKEVRVAVKGTSKHRTVKRTVVHRSEMTGRVVDLETNDDRVYAATSNGLYWSADNGAVWHGGPLEKQTDFVSVQADGPTVVAGARKALLVSLDRGQTWKEAKVPDSLSSVVQVALAPRNDIWVIGREGAFHTRDNGDTWEYAPMPVTNLSSITYDANSGRILVTAANSTALYSTTDGKRWEQTDAGWLLRQVRDVRGRLVATTAFDGIVEQPEAASSASLNQQSSGENR